MLVSQQLRNETKMAGAEWQRRHTACTRTRSPASPVSKRKPMMFAKGGGGGGRSMCIPLLCGGLRLRRF